MKVVIIDDHPVVRQGLSSVLSIDQSLEFVGEASNVKEGIEVIEKIRPDLALVDLRLGTGSGFDVIEKIKEMKIDCKFAILTTCSDEENFKKAEAAGVQGFIFKDAMPDEIMHAIKLIGNNRRYYDPSIFELIINEKKSVHTEKLTQREKEVLIALGKGLNNKQIANSLFITEYTVKKHIGQILSKLGLQDRTQAALYAINNGIIK